MTLICNENHQYHNENGIYVPNVTTILEKERYVDFSMVNRSLLEAGQSFGTNVHTACYFADKGTLDYDALSQELLPYVIGWKKFLSISQAEILHSEIIVHSKRWNFCGRLDRILRINGRVGIYDIKTGGSCSLQTAGYKIAVEEDLEIKIKDRFAVKLVPGSYKLIPHNDKNEENLFKSLAIVHNSRKNYIKGE